MSEALLRMRDVTKSFGASLALDGVSLRYDETALVNGGSLGNYEPGKAKLLG